MSNPENRASSSTMTSSASTSTSTSSSCSFGFKLRKIPPIPVRRGHLLHDSASVGSFSPIDDSEFTITTNNDGDDDDNDDDEDFMNNGCIEGDDGRKNPNTPIIVASALGLNHIRTRSAQFQSPLRFSSSSEYNVPAETTTVQWCTSQTNVSSSAAASTEQCPDWRKVAWSQSKPYRQFSHLNPALESNPVALAKEVQSPRFQAILRVTSGRKKKAPDVKSFSHELNSKGVRPFPVWKSRAFGHMEEVMVGIRKKFVRLKDEVNADLGLFAGDLVGILEKTSDPHPEWRETLEDLLLVARQCAVMTSNEFWMKCEGIVQNLDDRRQELPMGILRQAHTRLLFILTRCTRIVQFQKESGYDLGFHQLSDLGVYPEKILEIVDQDYNGTSDIGRKLGIEKMRKKIRSQEQSIMGVKQHPVDHHSEANTGKNVESPSSSYRMSSWKKLPSARDKNRKGDEGADTPSKDKLEPLKIKDEIGTAGDDKDENLYTAELPPPGGGKKVTWGLWGEQHSIPYDNSMICRICEVEIPIVHVQEHSIICTIADRCDLKGLTVNERLERVAETLERILDSWTPKSTPKSPATPKSPGTPRGDESDELSPKRSSFSGHCSEDMLDLVPDAFITEDLNILPDISCETRSNMSPDRDKKTSVGTLTPRSPLLTPRTSQIELLLSGRRTITELENYQQISKLLDLARSVANVSGSENGTLECMLDHLEDLKYAIQDRKADALIVETFGRRIEKLLQEKYVQLVAEADDEKLDSLTHLADEDSSVEEDTSRSLRASPINICCKDRTSIEDFEIIKPISRGAYGRVFLAKKRTTGDFFAIKVLRKSDMIRKNAVENILAERDILISARNPFVVRLFYSFTCRENLYLVMEYLNGGDLYSLLKNLGCLDEDMARIYIAEVVLALEYLHSLNVIHRDLKPDNLLIGQDGHLKLTDFGLSKVGLIDSTDDFSGPSLGSTGFLDDDEPKGQPSSKQEQRQKHSVVGTPDYLAPEILLGMGHGATADWWSVGIVLFEMLVGVPPFNAETPQKIFDNIMNRDIPWPKVPEEMSYEAHDLIDKLLTENSVQRLGATGAKEVKRHPFFKDISWDTLARQKAMFIPAAEAHDTSYFMSRYIWGTADENFQGGSDFDEFTDSSNSSFSNTQDEDGDECRSLTEFHTPTLAVQYSFSNFSFKNLSQLASINYDLVVKSTKDAADASKHSVP
ncbi:hypothetical protein Tsubulata_022866 [Turnera subulata]|uniref:non-specific serine/threonine protein kinase n=1 Tax=Turnera subulata TaxID=218843 RepID=A0A9Q0FCT0_9ROSI|nr:hypothetical protein Tsubulata_022866 [Turnera subulata]